MKTIEIFKAKLNWRKLLGPPLPQSRKRRRKVTRIRRRNLARWFKAMKIGDVVAKQDPDTGVRFIKTRINAREVYQVMHGYAVGESHSIKIPFAP